MREIKEIRERIPAEMEIEALFTEQCVYHIPEDVCLVISLPVVTQIREHARIRAAGNIPSWKRTRPGEYMPVYENERGTYIFNSKDLNMIEYIDQILDAGIDSLKIEGRMKTALYVATVARTYRKAIDDCKESVEKYRANMDYYKEEIAKCTYRQFTTGFYFGKTDETSQIYDSNTYIKNCTYIGIVQGHNDKDMHS